MRRFLERLSAKLPERRIIIDGELYLQRFYLWGKMPADLAKLWNCGETPKERLGFLKTTYLHCFHLPDKDRDCHNHPWKGWGRILVGGYTEERWIGHPSNPSSFKTLIHRRQFAKQELQPNDYHRVATLDDPTVWTLFRIGDYEQSWGYWSEAERRHVPHQERHANPNED